MMRLDEVDEFMNHDIFYIAKELLEMNQRGPKGGRTTAIGI